MLETVIGIAISGAGFIALTFAMTALAYVVVWTLGKVLTRLEERR